MSRLTDKIKELDDERCQLSEQIRPLQERIDKIQRIMDELSICRKAAVGLTIGCDYQVQLSVTDRATGITRNLNLDILDEFVKTTQLIIEHARELCTD